MKGLFCFLIKVRNGDRTERVMLVTVSRGSYNLARWIIIIIMAGKTEDRLLPNTNFQNPLGEHSS